jgi:hypothetical protein
MRLMPNGQVQSGYCTLSEWTDSDGTVYTETAEDRRWQAEQHKTHVLAFKARVTDERLTRARGRPQHASRPTRPGRVAVVRRSRLARRTSAPTRGSPDDDPAPSSPFEPLPPLPAIRGQLQLGPGPWIGGGR